MNLKEYQELAAVTMSEKARNDWQYAMLNWALGLTGEVSELVALNWHYRSGEDLGIPKDITIGEMSDRLKKEYGDILWYIAACATSLGVDLEDLADYPEPEWMMNDAEYACLVVFSGQIAEIMKKHYFHGHDFLREGVLENLSKLLTILKMSIADTEAFSFEEVCEANIAKLTERYPEGFEAHRSINRKD